jgi:hypothetical protein
MQQKHTLRRSGALVLLLLFLMMVQLNFAPSSVTPAIGIQSQPHTDSVPAADGDVSSESITSFSETLPDDTLFYPDAFLNETPHVPDAGHNYADWTKSQVKDGTSVIVTSANDLILDFVSTTPTEYVDVNIYGTENGGAAYIYDWDTSSYTDTGFAYTTYHWGNYTFYGDYVNSTDGVKMKFAAGGVGLFGLDYVEVQWHYMTLEDSNHYAESFSGVDDWSIHTGSSMGTDGDLMYVEVPNDNNWDIFITNGISLATQNYYIEFRTKFNTTSGVTAQIVLKSGDGYTGTTIAAIDITESTDGTTTKSLITSALTTECVAFVLKSSTNPVKGEIDYLRISPADESGWQHDGSTTEGVEAFNGGSVSSDGDYLSLVSDADGAIFNFTIDTTATGAAVSPVYYQFVEVKIHADDVGNDVLLRAFFNGVPSTILSKFTTTSATIRANVRAITGTGYETFQIFGYSSQTTRIDYVKAYSIANFTYTSASATTSDVCYVNDDNSLVIDYLGGIAVQWAHDPLLSIDTSTYNVLNISTPTGLNSFTFKAGLSPWQFILQDTTDTRAGIPSGTLTDFYMTEYGGSTISAIKFIEDSTAPSVVRSFYNPRDPDDNEQVTLSCVVTDAVEVYSVAFNAITYPAGFSDIDYDATEGQENLWTYTFSTLTAGYYVFTISASDGANTNSLGAYSYIEITVRDTIGTLKLEDPLLLEWDDVYLNIWSNPNKACTLYVYDNDTAAASGSVPAVGSTVRYALDNSEGLHDLDFLLTDGSTSLWPRNDTYYTVTAKWSDLDVVDFVASGTVQSVLGYSWATPLNGTVVYWQTSEESGNTTSNINGGITVELNSGLYTAGTYDFEVWTAATTDHWIVSFDVQQLGFTSATFSRLDSYHALITAEGASYADQLYDVYVEDYTPAGTSSYVLVAHDVLSPAIVQLDVDNSNQRDWKIIAVDRLTDGNYIQSSTFSNSYTPGNMPNTEPTRGGAGYNPWTDPFNWFMLMGFGAFAAGIWATHSEAKKGRGDIPNAY